MATNIFRLFDVAIQSPQVCGITRWKSAQRLRFQGDLAVEWDRYIHLLYHNFISLKLNILDSLCCSRNPMSGDFTTKLGYKAWIEDVFEGPKQWWWKAILKLNAPLQSKISTKLVINNKLVTWEAFSSRGWRCPSSCTLCKSQVESALHLFFKCSFVPQVYTLIHT